MNYYDRILELLESSYQMPSGRGKAIAGEVAARRRFRDVTPTLTGGMRVAGEPKPTSGVKARTPGVTGALAAAKAKAKARMKRGSNE